MVPAQSMSRLRGRLADVLERLGALRGREDQIFLVLTVVVGALVGLVTVSFIVLTENLGARMYPPQCAPHQRS